MSRDCVISRARTEVRGKGGRVYITRVYPPGPHHDLAFSSTEDIGQAERFSRDEAEALIATRHWNDPRIEAQP